MVVADTGDPAPSWESTLADLEQAVTDVERMVSGSGDRPVAGPPWQPPQLGPIPEEFRVRAAALLDRQAAAERQLNGSISQARKVRSLAARMSARPARPVAAYVDTEL